MARSWYAPQLLLAIVVALVALTYQARKKTFVSVEESSVSEVYMADTMQFLTNEFNKESDDKYNFRIVRVLKVTKLITDHMELHVNLELRRTTCQKLETSNCTFQEGEHNKQIYTVFAIPWFEKYKVLKKNCTNSPVFGTHSHGHVM